MKSPINGVLTVEQAAELTPWEKLFLRLQFGILPPIAGADGPDDGGGEDEGEHEGGADDEGDELDDSADEADEDEGEGGGRGRGRGRSNLRDDEQVVSKSEFERLRRIANEADAARKKAEREAARRAEQEAREAGNWEELLRERDERIAEAEAAAEASRLELDATLRAARITAAANKLGYRDPADAQFFLSEDETQDDSSTERALKRLAREKPYLVNERRSSGAPINGDGGPMLTIEEIRRMSPDEVNARWAEVQQVMTQQGSSR